MESSEPKLGKLKVREVKKRNLSTIQWVTNLKTKVVYRFFWGRSTLYKTYLHSILGFLTVSVIITGFSAKFISSSSASESFEADSAVIGDVDSLEQGGSIQTILVTEDVRNYHVDHYVVADGDTLDSIAERFGVTKDTIKWANTGTIDYHNENVTPGNEILIPEINGILYEVKDGDTVDSVVEKVENANRFDVIEINNLRKPDYSLTVGTRILVPGGTLPAPAKPNPIPSFTPTGPNTSNVYIDPGVAVAALSGITFLDPLSHPACSGYGYSRGFTAWHTGVDLTKGAGCPIRAAAGGVVTTAGWGSGGQGYYVTIDHGNGVKTSYFHGDGNIWVRVGDYVNPGQEIMQMGCTGYCTGTHLHLVLIISGIFIDPSPYIPYARPY